MEKLLELIFTKSDGAKNLKHRRPSRRTHPCRRQNGSRQDHSRQRVLTSGGLELTEFTEARIKTVIIDVLA